MHKYQTIVWKCPDTKQLFKTKKGFLKHRISVLIEKRARRRQLREALRRREVLRQKLERVGKVFFLTTIEDIAQFVTDHWMVFVEETRWPTSKQTMVLDRLWFENPQIRHDKAATHSNPEGHARDWYHQTKRYPAITGTIRFIAQDTGFEFNRMLGNRFKIHTGSGSGGTNGSRYTVEFWAHDYPALWLNLVYGVIMPEGTTLDEMRKQFEIERVKQRLAS